LRYSRPVSCRWTVLTGMSWTNTPPPYECPRVLWRLSLRGGHEAHAVLDHTTEYIAVVWFLDGFLQEAVEFENRDDAERCAEDVRRMLTARAAV
jgi:hypothetical protein